MGQHPDEELPEVVVDPSPQALTKDQAQYRYHHQDDRDKYHVDHDDSPELASKAASTQEPPHSLARSTDGSVPRGALADSEQTTDGLGGSSEKLRNEPTICGLRRMVFLLLLVAALVVVAAAVGGGVGGSLAAARSRQGSEPAASTSSSSSFITLPSSR